MSADDDEDSDDDDHPDDDDSDDDDDDDEPDTGKKDAGSKVDAATAPNPGDPCTGTQSFRRSCGNCGTQTAFCFSSDGGTSGAVGEYGPCAETGDRCAPGTTETVSCGNCGTVSRTCNAACTFVNAGACAEPANACAPGATQYAQGACPAGSYAQATCLGTCQWSGFGACEKVSPAVSVTAGPVGTSRSVPFDLSLAKADSRISQTCPNAALVKSKITYPYEYILVKNASAKPIKTTIYVSQGAANKVIDTMMAVYDGDGIPLDDAARKACAYGTVDQSTDVALTGHANFPLIGGVTVPANGAVVAWAATYAPGSANNTGGVTLNVRTDD